jgi:large subunit ribosomal protein L30
VLKSIKYLTVNLPVMAEQTIRIKQVRSGIDRPKRQKATLIALGLRRMNQVVEHQATPQILGMVKKVEHLVKVEQA